MKTIIFDFDGTIADSFVVFVETFEEVTNRKQKLTQKEIESLRGKSLRGILGHLKIKKWQIPRLVIKGKKALGLKISSIKPFAEMPDVLKNFHVDGRQMFILSTNSSGSISKFLKSNGMESYFERIYGDIGLRSKASALKKLMKKENIQAQDCVYVGDEVRDVVAAKKAGVTSIAVAWGFNFPKVLKQADPDALAEAPKDLINILR